MKKRLVSVIMGAALSLGLITVPGSMAQVSAAEEPYTVTFAYITDSENYGEVAKALDELAMKEINMHVNLRPMTWATYLTNLNLVMAAGEDIDIIVNVGQSLQVWKESGYIEDWAAYLDQMPNIVDNFGDDLNMYYTNGELLSLPVNTEMANGVGFVCRKDIMDELGLSEKDFSVDIKDPATFDQITDLFAKVKEAHPEMTVYSGYNSFVSLAATSVLDPLGDGPAGLLFGEGTTVTNFFESDTFHDICSYAKDWYDAGYTSADAATTQDSGQLLMSAGNLFCWASNTKPNTAKEAEGQTGYEVVVINAAEPLARTRAGAYCLCSSSKDPEKAAEFYNWFFGSAEANDLLNWGIEGVDWVEDENGQAAFPEGVDATSVGYHNDYGWMYPNQFIGHAWAGNDPDIWEQYKEYNANMKRSDALGFAVDATDLTDQIAQCTAVNEKYIHTLGYGTIDIEQGIADFNDELYMSGLQDIIDAKQSQLDEWMASKE